MERRFVFVLLAAALGTMAPSRAAAEPEPSLKRYPMRFAVLGDRTGGAQEGVFPAVLEEVMRLRPDFVLNVGDMIEGYGGSEAKLRAEWEEFKRELKVLTVPVHLAPGNHDIWDDKAVKLYEEIVGKPYYSFTRRGVHFVVLDTGRYEAPEDVPEAQLKWLEADLEASKDALHTVVVLHKPYWIKTVALGKTDPLHEIFKRHGVDTVFTGHYHIYFAGEFDGVRYASVGSSGGKTKKDPTKLKYHFVWAVFDGEKLEFSPVKKKGVRPWDNISAEGFLLLQRMREEGLSAGKVAVTGGGAVPESPLEITVRNLGDRLLEDTLKWKVPPGWSVEPREAAVRIEAGKTGTLSFKVSSRGALYPVPKAELKCPFGDDGEFELEARVGISRTVEAKRTRRPVRIDGGLLESAWSEPQTRLYGPKGKKTKVEPVEFFFAWDRKNLYLAAKAKESDMGSLAATAKHRDGPVYGEDCVGYFLQAGKGAPVHQIYFSPLGTIFDQKIMIEDGRPGKTDRSWNGRIQVKTMQGRGFWSMEARIPWSELGVKPRKGTELAVNFRRKQKRIGSSSNWQPPISYDPKDYGRLVLR